MKLLPKTIGIVLLSFFCLLAASLGFYYFYVLQDFLNIENDIVRRDASRVVEAIEAERELMRITAIDWAQWDDMYDYMENPNPKFEDSWSTYESYKALRITDTLFLNLEKSVVFGVHVDFEAEEVKRASSDSLLVKDLVALSELFEFNGEVPSRAVFGTVNGNLVLAASSPILDSNRSKPSRGFMIIIKQINEEFLKKIAEQTRLEIAVADYQEDASNRAILGELAWDKTRRAFIQIKDENSIQGFVAIKDGAERPILLLRIDESRPVYNQGIANLKLFLTFWIIASGMTILLAVVLLNQFILTRLKTVCAFLNCVSVGKNFSGRLEKGGNDELAQLSGDINQMLKSLSEAHEEVIAARQAAERANTAKSMFIAKVSHELRTPIGSITGLNRMILKRETSPAVRELVRTADRSAWNLLSILNEILDFAKAESGNLTLEKIPFDLRELMRETMSIVAGRLEGKDEIELVLDIDPKVPPLLEGDPTKVKQVLLNLLGNAAKFTSQGYVGLRIERIDSGDSPATISFRIWDTGVGIPAEKQETIFEPFKQADASVARQYQGTGLGLAIVKQFTEALGGTVSLESEAGKGTAFTVVLPLDVNGVQELRIDNHGSPWPAILLVGEVSEPNLALLRNLHRFGLRCSRMDSSALREMESAELLVVDEAALLEEGVTEVVCRRNAGTTVAVLNPASLDLKDRLLAAGLEHVLTAPVLAEDVLNAYLGSSPGAADRPVEKALTTAMRKLRILIADDTPTNLIILEDILTEAGHSVTTVGDGKALLDRLTPCLTGESGCEEFDIVLTDISMPILDGFAATQMVRDIERRSNLNRRLPIIAITAHAMKDEAERMRRAGVDGVVTKPIRPEAIEAELDRLLDGTKAR